MEFTDKEKQLGLKLCVQVLSNVIGVTEQTVRKNLKTNGMGDRLHSDWISIANLLAVDGKLPKLTPTQCAVMAALRGKMQHAEDIVAVVKAAEGEE